LQHPFGSSSLLPILLLNPIDFQQLVFQMAATGLFLLDVSKDQLGNPKRKV
jgi:hypothetical protein